MISGIYTNNGIGSINITPSSNSDVVNFQEVLGKVIALDMSNTNFLLTGSNSNEKLYKPSTKEFMDLTGATYEEAKVLYVDDGRDTRDWTKIMADSDPLKAARTATQQMYNDPNRTKTIAFVPAERETYAKTQNFIYYQTDDGIDRLALTDKNGVVLRQFNGDAEHIKNELLNFGFDVQQLSELQSILSTKGIQSPMIGDTKRNVFLDLNGIASYVSGDTQTQDYKVTSIDNTLNKQKFIYNLVENTQLKTSVTTVLDEANKELISLLSSY